MGIRHALPESWVPYRHAVQVELGRAIDSCPPPLRDMLRYHMGWQDEHGGSCSGEPGKFIRSTLCLLTCEAVGGDASQAVPAAVALELVHNFSLIHDDIQDVSYERHHRPAVWSVWGQSQAMNAGDTMFALAYLALTGLKERGVADEKITTSAQRLSLACLELCEGQYLDLDYEDRVDTTIEDYLDMAAGKTAALIATSTSLGAYLGGAYSGLVDALHSFGKELGMAYQIRDDVMGIWATSEETGKPAHDIPQRKKTLPVVYGLQSSGGEDRQRLVEIYAQGSFEGPDIAEVGRILERLGAREYAGRLAREYHSRAVAQLESERLEASGQARLREAASFLVERDF